MVHCVYTYYTVSKKFTFLFGSTTKKGSVCPKSLGLSPKGWVCPSVPKKAGSSPELLHVLPVLVSSGDEDADRPDSPKVLERRVQKEEHQMREKLKELFFVFNHRLFDSLLKMAKTSIDLLRKRLFYQPYVSSSGFRHSSSAKLRFLNQKLPRIAVVKVGQN